MHLTLQEPGDKWRILPVVRKVTARGQYKEAMKKRVHRWGCGITCGLVLTATLLALFRPRERLLLREAKRIADEDKFSAWVSDHEFITTPTPDEVPVHAPHDTRLPVFTRHDLTTGVTRSFTLPYRELVTNFRSGLQPSPDGNRVLWYAHGEVRCADLRT